MWCFGTFSFLLKLLRVHVNPIILAVEGGQEDSWIGGAQMGKDKP